MHIAVGSYDRILYGYTFDYSTRILKATFGFVAHTSCIRCVSICSKSGGILATGGQDELIKLFSLKSMRSLGDLFTHTGDVTCVEFFGRSHMLSGSNDGKIVIWRTKDWEQLHVLKGHKTAVTGITIHPSGKLALSVSSDRAIYCWNMPRGIKATRDRLPAAPVSIAFDPTGNHYLVHYDQSVDIHHTTTTQVHTRLRVLSKLHSVVLYGPHLITGSEDGHIRVYQVLLPDIASMEATSEEQDESTLTEPRLVITLKGHAARVRSARICRSNESPQAQDLIVSISSDGAIKIWDLTAALGETVSNQPVEIHDSIAETCTKSRLTCLAVHCSDLQPDVVAETSDQSEDDEE